MEFAEQGDLYRMLKD